MYSFLKDPKYYEELYDRLTIESARRGMSHYDDFYADFKNKLPEDEKVDKAGNAFLLNVFYMETVGNELLDRYENRDNKIHEWVSRDQAKDELISSARLTEEPSCHHCGKQGLRIIDKSLMHRGDAYEIDDPEEVLFILRCPRCDKNSAFWEDGTAWKVKPTVCPKCQSEVTHKTRRTKKAITTTYTCTSCKHGFKDKMDLTSEEEKSDPEFEKDRRHFCLQDQEFRDRLFKMRHDFQEMARLDKEFKEKEDNKYLYDAIKEIKKPKIAELTTVLAPALEKAGYIDFSLDKPEIGKDVVVGFNCLDGKNDRNDRDSEKVLKKTVEKALQNTNWRLMSNGISYRLGYLNGRLRAYEHEEDLKKLVERDIKTGKLKRPDTSKNDSSPRKLKAPDGTDIIL
jgi:transposase-like protein